MGTCLIAERMPELLKFVQDILPSEPFIVARSLWEFASNSIMAEKDFAVGGGKTPRKTKYMKAEDLPASTVAVLGGTHYPDVGQ